MTSHNLQSTTSFAVAVFKYWMIQRLYVKHVEGECLMLQQISLSQCSLQDFASKRMDSFFLSTDKEAEASKHMEVLFSRNNEYLQSFLIIKQNRMVRIIRARTPIGLLHEVLTWSNMANKMLKDRSEAYVNLHRVHRCGTNKVKGKYSKGLNFFDKFSYSFEQAKYWGVRLTIKL